MLTYWSTNTLKVVDFNDSDYACWMDDKKSTLMVITTKVKCKQLGNQMKY